MNIRLISPSDRVRLILTDGVGSVIAMLATQLKDYVDNGTIRVNTIITVGDYIANTLKDQK